ncbi:hypothetical protein WA026_008754 [Henosepilachna vigintioctopunctata]|uniref:Phospholipid scramblase n=1 Tax=Henosepilachna vigintioctopunctata TaxID=420089 RepID=A0AAW1V5K8_9CUCU
MSYQPANTQGGYPHPNPVYDMNYPPQGGQPGYPQPQSQYPPYSGPPGPYPPPPGSYPPPSGYQPVVTNQPMGNDGGWMNLPQGPVNCPPGLAYLTMIDQLLVHQKVELLEAFTGFETKNKFTVKNSLGQKLYYAVEDSDCCTRNCCGPMRPFDMRILDNFRNEVIHLHRPLACDSCCFPCCLQSMEVSAPPGNLVGTVEQDWSLCCPSFSIKNQNGDTVLKIDGPCCTFSFCGDVEFKVMSADGSTEVGRISKQWSGLAREMFTDSDFFGITFPMDLDVRMKAVMLGACFLIDAMFFEKKQDNRVSDVLNH